jgi:hypothetical protein
MHDFSGGVEGSLAFAVFDFQQFFKHLTEHFRVDGDFFFKRFEDTEK